MTDKPRIILDAKAWQEGFAAGRRGLKWNQILILLEQMHPARGNPACSSVKQSRCGRRTIKDNPWKPTLGDLRAVALTPGEDSVSE